MVTGLQVNEHIKQDATTMFAEKGLSLRDHLKHDYDHAIYKNVFAFLMNKRNEVASEIRENVNLTFEQIERLEFILTCFNTALDVFPFVHKGLIAQLKAENAKNKNKPFEEEEEEE